MSACKDNQEVGSEAAILERVRNSSLVECAGAENVTGLKPHTEAVDSSSGRLETGNERSGKASYRDLEVYQEAYRLALEVHRLTLGFPELERYVLAEQMRRASKSIPANIAEGYGLHSQRNFVRYLGQALGSCDEMQVHLDFARDLAYLSPERHAELWGRYDVLGKRTYALMRRWQQLAAEQP